MKEGTLLKTQSARAWIWVESLQKLISLLVNNPNDDDLDAASTVGDVTKVVPRCEKNRWPLNKEVVLKAVEIGDSVYFPHNCATVENYFLLQTRKQKKISCIRQINK